MKQICLSTIYCGGGRNTNTRKLFLAVYFNRSISAVGLTIDDASILPPILCNLVYLDDSLIPQMYLKLKDSAIENIVMK